MKRYITMIAAVAVGMSVLSSCDDTLNSTPQSDLTPDTYFRTETDFQLFTNPLYNNMLDDAVWTYQSDYKIGSTVSTIVRGGTARFANASDSGWKNWVWVNLRRINTCLYYLGKAPDADGNYYTTLCEDASVVSEYEGLCKFFRAYFYMPKIERYGDVPWIDRELGSADDALYNARDDREYVFHNMIEDIDTAIANLPEAVSTYRVNKWAALALKARMCLYEGTYRSYHATNDSKSTPTAWTNKYETASDLLQMAADAANQLMTGGKYKLYSTGNTAVDYMNLFAEDDANADEFILARKFNYALAIFNNATAYSVLATQGRPGFSKKFIDSYLMADGTRFTDKAGWETMVFNDEVTGRDPRLAQTIRIPGYKRIDGTEVLPPMFANSVTGYHLIKYAMSETANGGDSNRADRSTNDLPELRYAEVLLDYAEAKAELGTLTQDDLDKSINLLRKRAGMPNLDLAKANADPDPYLLSSDYGYTNIKAGMAGSNQGVILEIRREREIELAAEGETRWNDLMRWGEGNCLNQNIYGMYIPAPGEYDFSGDGNPDYCFYTGTVAPSTKATYSLAIGTDIYLTEGDHGYVDYITLINETHNFNPNRDYFYPIPTDDLTLNANLVQNPGWDN